MYRPSPQLPQPSPRAANICFDSAAYVLKLSDKQLGSGMFNVTWVFLITLNSCLNALLWSTSYAEVRQAHLRNEVEDLVNTTLTCLDKCVERWPGIAYTSELYAIISKACLQSYDRSPDSQQPLFSFASPSTVTETQPSPDGYVQAGGPQQVQYLNPPQFGFVFDSPPESMNAYTFDPNYPPPQPTFRSNSIFCNPATDSNGRRFSYFPPEFDQGTGDNANMQDGSMAPGSGPGTNVLSATGDQASKQLPTPPESLPTGAMSATTPSTTTLSPPNLPAQPSNLSDASSAPRVVPMADHMTAPQKMMAGQAQPTAHFAATARQPSVPQRPLPGTTTAAEWFSPPPPFVSPYNFGVMSNNFFNDAMPNTFAENPAVTLGGELQSLPTGFDASGQFGFLPGRQGSLTQSQQMELMNALETEGVGDIDAFLNASNNMADVRWY